MTVINKVRPLIGVGVLVWRDNRLLLGKRLSRNQPGCWQFPGGHLETGESVIECARREVQEEAGLIVSGCRHLGFTDRQFTVAGQQYVTLLVSCEYTSGELQVLEPDKCERWQWFDYPQLPQPLFEPISIFMAQHSDLYALHCSLHKGSGIPSDVHR